MRRLEGKALGGRDENDTSGKPGGDSQAKRDSEDQEQGVVMESLESGPNRTFRGSLFP